MRHKSIKTKLVMPVVLVMLVAVLMISALNAQEYGASYRDALEERTEAIARNIREAVYQNLRFFSLSGLSGVSEYLTSVVESSQVLGYATIADASGFVLYRSQPPLTLAQSAYRLPGDLPDGAQTLRVGSYYETVLPIVWHDEVIGTIALGVERQIIDRQITIMLVKNLAGALAGMAICSLLLVRLLDRGVVRSVSRLSQAVSRLEAGDMNASVTVDRDDEFGALARAFNQMTGRVRGLVAGQEQHIAELKNTEDALRRSQMRYRALFDGVPIGLYRTSRDGRILAANATLAEMLGYPDVESLLKVSANDFYLFREDRRTWLDLGPYVRIHAADVQLKCRDGRVIWARDRAHIVFDENEQIVCFDGSLEEITEQKQAEQDLRLRDRAIASAISGIGIANLEGILIYANNALASMWGYDGPHEIVGLRLEQLIGHDQSVRARHDLADRGWSVGESTVARRDDSEFQVQMSMNVVTEEHGEVQHLFASFADITARKKLAEQLLQAQKMEVVGRLAGGIAHDFNNLLTVINGYSQFALQSVPKEDPLHADLELIDQAGQRAADLTQRLLAFSRRQVAELSVVDLNQVLDGMGRMLGYIIGDDVTLNVANQAPQSFIMADSGQIEQVVMNLASNARDAMPLGGRLTIGTETLVLDSPRHASFGDIPSGDWIVLTVSDTGTGMSSDVQEHLFEPFFTTKEVGKGTGLGLAMIYGIVEEAGGHVDVVSMPGQGTTFSLFLPRVDWTGQPVSGTDERPVPGGNETVLVVDDRDEVRAWLGRALNSLGYATIDVSSGAEALDVLSAVDSQVDLVLTDVAMPQMNGFELAHAMRALCPDIPLIYVTGHGRALDEVEAGYLPNTRILSKPLTVQTLGDCVFQTLREAH